ncbi:hypothetical protein MMAG44476_27804, partial [Mycolicibacterium mageritense DSM 44476 = CIP 104973]
THRTLHTLPISHVHGDDIHMAVTEIIGSQGIRKVRGDRPVATADQSSTDGLAYYTGSTGDNDLVSHRHLLSNRAAVRISLRPKQLKVNSLTLICCDSGRLQAFDHVVH